MTIFRFIAARRAEHSIKIMCRVLDVSRSGFHAWARREPSARAVADRALSERIAEIHADSGKTYGSPRVHAELRLEDGVRVGRKRVERLMRAAGLSGQARRRRGKTTIRVQGVRTAPDLVERDFAPAAVNRLWCADITYIRTWEGWLYLASVMDCYSRRIVGWAIADHLRAELVVDALEMAVARRRPDAGLVHHSDQGSQYTSLIFTRRCRSVGIDVSMGSRGDCFDNAVLESFHASLQEGRHPPPLVADQGRRADRGLRLHRNVLQPPAPPLDAPDALAPGHREQHSHRRRCQSRRFAARIHQQDELQVNSNGASRLTTACLPKRGRSTALSRSRSAHSTGSPAPERSLTARLREERDSRGDSGADSRSLTRRPHAASKPPSDFVRSCEPSA
ncbi:MAG: IS3 family transposase [Solirubrobacteraceae bacterium]